MDIDLHKLADTPGFGVAAKELKAVGAWDEHGAEDGEPREFSASVNANMPCRCTIKVVARSESEAEDLIIEKVSNPMFSDWHWDSGAEDIDVFFD